MTARPPAPALTAVLDELDELRANGDVALPLMQSTEFPSWVEQYRGDGSFTTVAECAGEDRAALIVAAVNRLPQLTAALRAVLADHDGRSCCDRTFESLRGYEPCPTVAPITTALEAS